MSVSVAILITVAIVLVHCFYLFLVKIEKKRATEIKKYISKTIEEQSGSDYVVVTQKIYGRKNQTTYISEGNFHMLKTNGKNITEHRMIHVYQASK